MDSMPLLPKIDPVRFRETLGHYPTGVVVVTAIADDGEPVGMVVGSFTSVSLDPPLVAYLPTRTSSTFARLRTAQHYCVNVLADDQGDLCRTFASKAPDKFDGVSWHLTPSGAPILDGAVAWIDCELESINDGGDHFIVLGRVRELAVQNPVPPLLFFQGGYGRFSPLSLVAPADPELIAGVRLADAARDEMEKIARDLFVECTAIVAVGDDLAVVASATGPDVAAVTTLGLRIPLIPPFGELYVAWEGPEVVDRWLARLSPGDSVTRAEYAERLAAARERGWSMTLGKPPEDSAIAEYLSEYTRGAATPAREREIVNAIAHTSARYAPVSLDAEQRFTLASLGVPVLGPDGHVALMLRLTELRPEATGAEVRLWVDRLLLAAERVAARLVET